MKMSQNQFKRMFKNPKKVTEDANKFCYFDDNAIVQSDLTEIDPNVIEYTDRSSDPYPWTDIGPGTHKSSNTGILITDAKGNQHRVYSTFTKFGFKQIIIKERYYPLVKGKPVFYTHKELGIGSITVEDQCIWVKTLVVDFHQITKRLWSESLMGEQTTPLIFEY